MDKSFEKLINRVLDGRYRIESVVGIGGMAYVLRALDLKNPGRVVAVKVLNEEFNRDENAVKRFVNESETIAMVDSPNIVKIYDVAISDNLKYIVMEYIDGITLKDYIDKVGALGWKEAVHYVRQILTALSHAHEKGIIHRDIKPQNVMLLRDGKVKVTDFGIAKGPTSENLTMTDKAIGTVNYISPEQASGASVDEKSDVYSVGVMLYEMLTGKLPFTAESPVAVAMMQVNDTPVPPREINAQIPVGLEQIILKAMSKKPEERFNCAMSFEKALGYFVKNPMIVFSGVSSGTNKGIHVKKNNEKDTKIHRSMFPIILGATSSILVVSVCVLLYMFWNYIFPSDSVNKGINKNSSDKGLGAVIDEALGIGHNNSDKNTMIVEDFTGKFYNEEVKELIESKGYYLKPIVYTGYYDKEDGMIVNQNPGPGDKIIKKDKVGITLYINKNDGETNKKMPDLIGVEKNSAVERIIRKFGPDIKKEDIEIIEEFNEKYGYGFVYDCIPQVGEEVDATKDKITIYVSKGKKMKMPMIVGKNENEAVELLKAEGITRYNVEYVENEEEAVGTVLEASVGTGLEVLSSDTVTIYVSKKSLRSDKPKEQDIPVTEPDIPVAEPDTPVTEPVAPEDDIVTSESESEASETDSSGLDALLGMREGN